MQCLEPGMCCSWNLLMLVRCTMQSAPAAAVLMPRSYAALCGGAWQGPPRCSRGCIAPGLGGASPAVREV